MGVCTASSASASWPSLTRTRLIVAGSPSWYEGPPRGASIRISFSTMPPACAVEPETGPVSTFERRAPVLRPHPARPVTASSTPRTQTDPRFADGGNIGTSWIGGEEAEVQTTYVALHTFSDLTRPVSRSPVLRTR